ncbi:hypothetical protein CEXT_53941 [Caerostris extrusa]|uniref:Competence protein n=1 Tax=Caerostris extrusa TaxID=172846 RepID=A0AAV4TUQ5_CAEEX|nr:hypothetical protein CEXT_53941 [Caerostris extrusa]
MPEKLKSSPRNQSNPKQNPRENHPCEQIGALLLSRRQRAICVEWKELKENGLSHFQLVENERCNGIHLLQQMDLRNGKATLHAEFSYCHSAISESFFQTWNLPFDATFSESAFVVVFPSPQNEQRLSPKVIKKKRAKIALVYREAFKNMALLVLSYSLRNERGEFCFARRKGKTEWRSLCA